MLMHAAGAHYALASLGMIKEARPTLYDGPDGERLPMGASIGAHVYRQLLGKPATYLDELRTGKWLSPGSYTRGAMWPAGALGPKAGLVRKGLANLVPALYYLPSALGLYAATQAPSELKGESYGNALGTLIGTALGAPLGILGTSIGGMAGGSLGQSVGKYLQHGGAESAYYDASAQGPA